VLHFFEFWSTPVSCLESIIEHHSLVMFGNRVNFEW